MSRPASPSPQATGAVAISDPTGLHARPAVKLTRLAKSFESAIEIRPDSQEKWANAKSPNAVMKLKVGHGEVLHIRAEGDDARTSVDALIDLVERNFDG